MNRDAARIRGMSTSSCTSSALELIVQTRAAVRQIYREANEAGAAEQVRNDSTTMFSGSCDSDRCNEVADAMQMLQALLVQQQARKKGVSHLEVGKVVALIGKAGIQARKDQSIREALDFTKRELLQRVQEMQAEKDGTKDTFLLLKNLQEICLGLGFLKPDVSIQEEEDKCIESDIGMGGSDDGMLLDDIKSDTQLTPMQVDRAGEEAQTYASKRTIKILDVFFGSLTSDETFFGVELRLRSQPMKPAVVVSAKATFYVNGDEIEDDSILNQDIKMTIQTRDYASLTRKLSSYLRRETVLFQHSKLASKLEARTGRVQASLNEAVAALRQNRQGRGGEGLAVRFSDTSELGCARVFEGVQLNLLMPTSLHVRSEAAVRSLWDVFDCSAENFVVFVGSDRNSQYPRFKSIENHGAESEECFDYVFDIVPPLALDLNGVKKIRKMEGVSGVEFSRLSSQQSDSKTDRRDASENSNIKTPWFKNLQANTISVLGQRQKWLLLNSSSSSSSSSKASSGDSTTQRDSIMSVSRLRLSSLKHMTKIIRFLRMHALINRLASSCFQSKIDITPSMSSLASTSSSAISGTLELVRINSDQTNEINTGIRIHVVLDNGSQMQFTITVKSGGKATSVILESKNNVQCGKTGNPKGNRKKNDDESIHGYASKILSVCESIPIMISYVCAKMRKNSPT